MQQGLDQVIQRWGLNTQHRTSHNRCVRRSGGSVGVAMAVGECQADRRAGSSLVAHVHCCDELPAAAGLELLGVQPDHGTAVKTRAHRSTPRR